MPEPSKESLYPVQPTFITVREVHFIALRPPSENDRIDESSVRITQTASQFNEETNRVQVTLTAEFGFENTPDVEPPPFAVKLSMVGEFVIEDSFPREKIQLWASRNAPFVIFPYLRERLYTITNQGGYPAILLPLLQIPTLKLEKQQPTPAVPGK
jgi:preprotein translocase subunit SecB